MLGVALLVCASTAAALSLGRARGAVLVGRSLDLTVQTTLDAQEPLPEVNCLVADVFYGDVRVSPNGVSVTTERSAAGEARIRIRTNAAVDEPVVTLYLRSSCGASVSRRYVLLADTLTEAEASLPAVIAPVQIPRVTAPPIEPAPPPPRTSAAPATSAGGGATTNSSAATERAAQRQARRQERARLAQERAEQGAAQSTEPVAVAGNLANASRSIMRQTSPRKASGPRLQVDLLDLASYEPSLRSSNELTTEPTQDAAVRSQAQALWRSLNASPEEAMRDAKRLETLEAQMRVSLEQSKRQGQDIATLATQLQAANQARYFNPFTIFLGLLTLLALGLTAWLWRRNAASGQPWYRGHAERASQDESHLWEQFKEEPPVSASSILSGDQPAAPTRSGPSVPASRAANPALDKSSLRFAERPTNPLEFAPPSEPTNLSSAKIQPLGSSMPAGRGGSMGRVDSTPPPSLMPQPKPSARAGANSSSSASRSGFGNTDFGQSGFANSRLIAAEELFDIQEQADFFMSLGQPDQAIEVLKNHITDNVETSALAYMDLFDIYHRANRKKDYDELRQEFNRVFNAQAPNFDEYGQQNNGLESYPDAIENIQRYWPGPQTLDVIEESIFRQPDSESPPFDMLAYRELMLLYALAKELNKLGASFMPVQAIAPILGVSSNGSAQDDQATDSGQVGLSGAASENECLGLDLSYAGSDELNEAIARDTTFRIPKLPKDDDYSLDFDLSEAAEFPKGKPTV
jgi:hypothetical protein